ncbi:MAG: DNA topoisomerase 3, partial [Bacteroidota bacterium]
MQVCIAEKPSVAREIANVLGAKTRKDGYIEGNGYAVTWTFGHFCQLKAPDDYKPEWKSWKLDRLPMLPEKFETKLMKDKGVRKQFGVIKKLLKRAELVINCGDAGQEGELIQRWVLKEAKYKGKVMRLWISSLTTQAIRDGFQNLKPASQYDNLYYAGFSRAIGDWLLGMNATRLYTLKYGGYKQVLSVGRVQTPTLAMLVERHKEIENFVPQPYWELHTLFREVDFQYIKGRFEKKEDGEVLLAQVTGHPFTIVSATKKRGKETPPRLFDLTSLQVHCNKRFGYTADQTLKLVQHLYEKKVVTYPRVDTTYLPNDLYPKIPGILKKMNSYSQFTTPLLGKAIRKSSKVFNDKKVTDHHAIIPTGFEKSLAANEQAVYDAIARRFIAAFYPDCIVSNNTVIGESNKVQFKATGKEILDPGWRVLFPKPKSKTSSQSSADKKGSETNENILPDFKKGDTGPHEPSLLEKMTQPPKNYTEATLLRAMETAGKKVDDDELRDLMKANGIGRPSTRASIIETLFRRRYIKRQRKSILPTETGIQLIDTIQNPLLKSAELTGQWEKHLREMEHGRYPAARFVHDMKAMVDALTVSVRKAPSSQRISSTSRFSKTPTKKGGKANSRSTSDSSKKAKTANAVLTELHCPKCRKGTLLKGKSAYGCSKYKQGCSFRLPFRFMEKKIPEKQLLRLMKMGSTIQLKGFKQAGQKVNGQLYFDADR